MKFVWLSKKITILLLVALKLFCKKNFQHSLTCIGHASGFTIIILIPYLHLWSLFPLYSLKPKFLGDSKPPILAAVLRAIHRNKQQTGLQLVLYTDTQPKRWRIQMFGSSITGPSRWKLCADASVINYRKVSVSLKYQSAQIQINHNDLTVFYANIHLFPSTRALLNGEKIARTTRLPLRLQQGNLLFIQLCR